MLMFSLNETEMIIYKIVNKIDGKCYIGQTSKTFNKRYEAKGEGIERVYNYHTRLRNVGRSYNQHLLRAMEKFGMDNFEIEILEVCKTHEELNEKEMHHIKKFKSSDSSFGYNCTEGGDSIKRTKSLEKKMMQTRKLKKINKTTDIYNLSQKEEITVKVCKQLYDVSTIGGKRIYLSLLCYIAINQNNVAISTLKQLSKIGDYKTFYEILERINEAGFIEIRTNDNSIDFKINDKYIEEKEKIEFHMRTKYQIEFDACLKVNANYFGRKIKIRKCLSCGRIAAYSVKGKKKYCDACPRTSERDKEVAKRSENYYNNHKKYIEELYKKEA